MQPTVEHQPRIAWDAARVLVAAARADETTFGWCRDRIAALIGPGAAEGLDATRRRLLDSTTAPSETLVHTGLWRVRLEDALRDNPAVGRELLDVTAALTGRR